MRRIYVDVLRNKILKGNFLWLFKHSLQYILIHASFLVKKPLCGPILGTLLTNYTCNYRCQMCDLHMRDKLLKDKGYKELSTAKLKEVLREFAEIGTSGIGFTGGEPLLHKDIFELLRYTKELGMVAHLNTNGSLLSEKNVDELLETGLDSINISLDGATAKTHDKIRGIPGAFEKATQAITLISGRRKELKAPLRIKTVTVLSEDNIDEVAELVNLAVRLKVDCIEFIPEQHFKTGSCSKESFLARYSEDFFKKLDNVVDYLLKVKDIRIENSPRHLKMFKKSFKAENSPLTCYAGYNSFGVDCYGLIYPCMPWFNWNRPAGNLKQNTLKDFWYSKEYDKTRKIIAKCKDCYINCQAELNLLFNL